MPTSNVDIAPTVLYIHQIPLPSSMEGRVMHELLANGKRNTKQPRPKTEITHTSVKHGWGTYLLTLQRTILGNYQYVDFAKVKREPNVVSK